MSSFDKFAWLKALVGDPSLTDKESRLAVLLCVSKTRRDGTGWRVYLDELATEMPGGGVNERWMRRAFQKLVKRGYFVEWERSVGGRGMRAFRRLDVSKPGTAQSRVSEKPGTTECETRYSTVPNPVLSSPEKPAPTCSDAPPKVPIEGTLEGTPPSRYCVSHQPNGTGKRCPACGEARKRRESWDLEQEQQRQVIRTAIRKAIDECPDCDFVGRLDIGRDCPKHPNFRQHPEEGAA